MNRWYGIGRCTKDPEVRYAAQTQKAIARFTLAIDEGYGENKKTNFINCVAFGKTAEACEKFTGKGLRVAVEGHIQTGSYEKDGGKVYTTDIICDKVEFVDWKQNGQKPASYEEAPAGFSAIDEEIPF